jgi:hypothetical protein
MTEACRTAIFASRDVNRLLAPVTQLWATKLAIVARLLWCSTTTEIYVTKLTQPVVFIRETEPSLTSDHWKVVINFNLTPCVTTVETIQQDLMALK